MTILANIILYNTFNVSTFEIVYKSNTNVRNNTFFGVASVKHFLYTLKICIIIYNEKYDEEIT